MRAQRGKSGQPRVIIIEPMEQETAYERLSRLMDRAKESRQFTSRNKILLAAGLSSGYMAELRGRCAADPHADITSSTAVRLAEALGISLYEITGFPEQADTDDPDTERWWAVGAARRMQLPEAAIQAVLRESPGAGDRWYWWLRIETVARQVNRPPSGRFSQR